jgi:nucleoside-diphosphate-sugar epimerase
MMQPNRPRILVTGAAGRIGETIVPYLRKDYALRLMFHRKRTASEGDDEVVVVDLASLPEVEAACQGVTAIVHLAADPSNRAPWESVLSANVVGTYNVFEAARNSGVEKIVFASTNHVSGWYEREGIYTTPDMPVRPDSLYGASKAFGEALGRYYSDAFGLAVVCLRIGSFLPKPTSVRALSTWLSYRDCAQIVLRSLDSDLRFGIFYGISRNRRRYWDISSAEAVLGYRPVDDAEEFAAEVEGRLPSTP